ncbi:MAG: LUD domain-containing protein [Gemmatimonadaceae bacterium]
MSTHVSNSAKDAILQAVRAARPPAVARPAEREVMARESDGPTLLDEFITAATVTGAVVLTGARGDVARLANGAVAGATKVLSFVDGVSTTVDASTDPHALAALDLFVIEATLGVAENGAVWMATSDSWRRAALFLATRVVIIVEADAIVPDMHDAYARIDVRAHSFGAFIAGPSKTADIEQALVVGAHGPRELTVIVVQSSAQAASTALPGMR